ncbi:MAG: beta-propeller domain-containing protein [Clostridia bacterium]|nr:beta-propeller domain-containing protein [Clostridia bacterium]
MKKRITSLFALLLCLFLVSCGMEVSSDVSRADNESSVSVNTSLPPEENVSSETSETEDGGYSSETLLVLPEKGGEASAGDYTAVKKQICDTFTGNEVRDDYRVIIENDDMIHIDETNDRKSSVYSPMGITYSDQQNEALQRGDVIKSDSRFIYLLSFGELTILSAENGKTEQVSVTRLPDQLLGIQMLLYKNQVIIICANEDPYLNYKVEELSEDNRGVLTSVFVVEVSESGKTRQKDYYVQSGAFAASRMVNDEIVLITCRFTNLAKSFYDDDMLSDGELMRELPIAGRHFNDTVPAENIDIPKETYTSTLTVISKTSLSDGEMNAYCKMADDFSFYISEDSIYVFYQTVLWYGNDGRAHLEIERYDITGKLPVYIGKTSVHGWMCSSAISEYNGYLRIPTYEDYGAGLIILDKELNVIGELYGIGGNQQDPLPHDVATYKNIAVFGRDSTWWTVDISDPASPKVTGSADGKGNSYHTVFLDDGYLLTSVFYRDYASDYAGLKLETYDVSDEMNIKKTGEMLLENESRQFIYMLSPGLYQETTSETSGAGTLVMPYVVADDNPRYVLAMFSYGEELTLTAKQELVHTSTSEIKTSKWQMVRIGDGIHLVNLAMGTKETDITSVSVYSFNADDLTPIGQYDGK